MLTLVLFLLAFFLLAQAINFHSAKYGLLFLVVTLILIKTVTRKSALFSLLTLISLWILIQSQPVQTWLVGKVSSKISQTLGTKISVGHVNFSFFNKMLLNEILVEDKSKDTILYAGQVSVRITDWFFLRDKIDLNYIGLDHVTVKLFRKDSVWNYQYLADYFSSPGTNSDKQHMVLDLKKIELSNIHLLKKDQWRGEDMELRLRSLVLSADSINFSKQVAHVQSLEITDPDFSISNYPGNRPEVLDTSSAPIKDDPKHLRWNPGQWDIAILKAVITNGSFKNDKITDVHPYDHFDGNHIHFFEINWNFNNLRLKADTLTADMKMNTKERSGFAVQKFDAHLRFFPEAMEFSNLDIQTGRSRLRKFFAMRFRTFDDMSDFTNKIRMEGDFTDANINSDDIAYFAPELKDWKKNIRITGTIKGPVADLHGRNILINAGKNTLLNGDIHLKGLPNIDSTFIEFKSNDFRTTYEDVVTLIPSLKKVTQPRIDQMEFLRFKGNFNGTIHNFVTSGTIESKLGVLVSDLNMKIYKGRPPIYSGTIITDRFALGQFLGSDNLGDIAFRGQIDGKGFVYKTLVATLNGKVDHLDFNGYTYREIVVNGTLAQNKFNGQLIAADSNLNATMIGLIDFSKGSPTFDFNADVRVCNLKKLHLTNDSIEFNGKLQFDFTGDDIDNFLGSARIYDASIYKKGERISFDSLKLESSIIDNNKTITVESNEFDGAIVGEFYIKGLPEAFQTFLNKYYPSYIKATKTKLPNQNFSFVISTRNVDEYLDMFAKNLKGFDHSNVTGRIDTKENLLDLNAEVPKFNYKKISFENVVLKARGNLDSLAIETSMGDVSVTDSLHFPGTHIKLKSYNDLSSIQVTTSANQTLNAANISAEVQTLGDLINIKFNHSTVDINTKTWTIENNGRLSFSKSNVSAEALRIYSGDEQILVTTSPSSEGNWNDVHVDLKKIIIGDFTPFFAKGLRIEGLLGGNATLVNPLNNPHLLFNGQADQFRFENDSIGKLLLTADYNKKTGLVNAIVRSQNKDYHFDLNGIFNTLDSGSEQPINITIPNLVDTRIDLLEKYLGTIFSNLDGYASGHLQIVGPANKLKYIGKIHLKDGSLRVNYTQCLYKIPSADFQFKDGSIDFGNFEIKDSLGNTASARGILEHQSFDDLKYDFEIKTSRLLLLNTKVTDNNQFYGTMIGRANLTLKGPQENMQMSIDGQPVDSSNIYLPTTTSRESADADFIVWKVYGKEMKPSALDRKATNFNLKMSIVANNYANVYVIIDPLTKDIIKANGHGNLLIRVGTNQDLDMKGRYDIDHGNYNFTFQSFIKKPFIFKEDEANYIQWTGNPYDADINIHALYEAENVQFSDLGFSCSPTGSTDKVNNYHGTVWVVATLSDKLMKPNIEFSISLPPNSPMKNALEVQCALQKITSDPNELNKQVAFLIVFNSFGPITNSTSTFSANEAMNGVFVSSISGALSNVLSKQFSNAFQKAFNDKSIRVNFNTSFYNSTIEGNSIDQSGQNYNRTNLNLSVIKSFLNERLTFTFGSALDFGLTAQQVQTSSVQFLPNITAEYKLTQNGRVVLTFFYRDSYNYMSSSNHTQNSSGSSISYRRDFDRIDELFKGKKKKETKPSEQPLTQ